MQEESGTSPTEPAPAAVEKRPGPGWLRIFTWFIPQSTDFYRLLNEQCDQAVATMEELALFMQANDKKSGKQVIIREREGDTLKQRNLDVLGRAFSTPFDREDVYQAIVDIDHIMNYAKSTVLEMGMFDVAPDAHTVAMALCLRDGTDALRQGFAKLKADPAGAELDAYRARKAERQVEKIYRKALVELFDVSAQVAQIREHKKPSQRATRIEIEISTIEHVMRTFKKREVYRHLSNAGDRLANAAATLHDIVVKVS